MAFGISFGETVTGLQGLLVSLQKNAKRFKDAGIRIFDVDKSEFGGAYESFLSRVLPEDVLRVEQVNAEARASDFLLVRRMAKPTRRPKRRRNQPVAHAW